MTQRITSAIHPKILYKYRDWDNEGHRRLITHQEIRLAQPYDFNDPFDCRIPVRWDMLADEQRYEKNLEMVKIYHNDKTAEQQILIADALKRDKQIWFGDNIQMERPGQMDKWNEVAGLISLSALRDNILMWSHYSNCHKGFVVGLHTEKLTQQVEFDFLDKVIYSEEYPIIAGMEDNSSHFHKKFYSKSVYWEYEQEWRLSKNHSTERVITLPTDVFAEIIIGCIVEANVKLNMVKCFRSSLPTVNLFEAKVHHEKFELVISKIN